MPKPKKKAATPNKKAAPQKNTGTAFLEDESLVEEKETVVPSDKDKDDDLDDELLELDDSDDDELDKSGDDDEDVGY